MGALSTGIDQAIQGHWQLVASLLVLTLIGEPQACHKVESWATMNEELTGSFSYLVAHDFVEPHIHLQLHHILVVAKASDGLVVGAFAKHMEVNLDKEDTHLPSLEEVHHTEE